MPERPLILIVDDIAKNLQVLGAVLYQENYEIAMADSGAGALETLEEITPELILLDIMMPEMDGYEVCEKIKSNPRLKDIPIIFLTAKNETENIIKGFQLGAADYVTKPFNAEELIARVRTHIDLITAKKELQEFNKELENKVQIRTQQLFEANERLLKLDDAKSYFLALIAHELNTPLNGIKGFIELLQTDLENPEHIEYCDYIIKSAERLKKFSDMSLLITSLKANKYEMNLKTQNVKHIIDESIEKFAYLVIEKNIEFFNDFPDKEIEISIDYLLFKKCVDIILNNSFRAIQINGKINIDSLIEDNELVIIFTDNGIGFPKDVLDNKFSLFISDEIMHHSDGYGLGLSTAKIIMDAHSGRIEIGNNPGAGAWVKLFFKINNHN